MKITIEHDNGEKETLDGSEVLIIDCKKRGRDVTALQEVLSIVDRLSRSEAERVLEFASSVIAER